MDKAAVIGVFDGVHSGHRHLLSQLLAEAERENLQPVAITFAQHPLTVVRPGDVPPLICPPDERASLLRKSGVEPEVIDFTQQVRTLTAAEFLKMLRQRGVRLLLMGFNNRIGSDRLDGNSELLAKAADEAGIKLMVASEYDGSKVSSSEIRRAVGQGEMEEAAVLLGRPFALEGEVVSGRQVGRTIGFPTANLKLPPEMLVPARGVYVGRALSHKAVINIGQRPTLNNGSDTTIEVHLLDFSGNLYGRTLRVEFLRRLRPEMKFNSLDELKAQIQKDIDGTTDI